MSEFTGRQLAAVFDLNKCLECHTCTLACKLMWTNRSGREYMYWNNVETMPGFGYPKGWRNGTNQTESGAGAGSGRRLQGRYAASGDNRREGQEPGLCDPGREDPGDGG